MAGRINPSDVLWQRLEDSRGWVLVFDNADDPAVLNARERAVLEGAGWFRRTDRGLLLVTTRLGAEQLWGSLATVHHIGPLSTLNGAQMLLGLAPQAGNTTAAEELAERLGCLPLALHQAGSYLRSPFAMVQTFTAYAQALETRFIELLGVGDDERARVVSTWELSLDALSAQGRTEARVLLQIVSCFSAPVPIPSALLDAELLDPIIQKHCGNSARTDEGLSALLSVGLINKRDPDTPGARPLVVVHPLVAETIRRRSGEHLSSILTIAVGLLSSVEDHLDPGGHLNRSKWLAILPHLHAVFGINVAVSADILAKMADSAAMMAHALEEGGAYVAALRIADIGLKRTAELGSEDKRVLALYFMRASAYTQLGRGNEAEVELRPLLAEQSRILGSEHPDTLSTHFMLGMALAAQGKPKEAENVYRQVLDVQTNILGQDHRDTLATRHEIARMLRYQGKLADAEAQYRQVLDVQLRTLRPDDPQILDVRHDIANVVAARGRLAEAETAFRQVLRAELQVSGADHPLTLATRSEIARVLADLGRLSEAEAGFREVLSAKLRVLGPDHPSTLLTRQLLASVRADQGHLAEAKAELQQVRDAELQVLGSDHPQNLDTRHEIARVLADLGRLSEAEAGFREVLSAKLRVLGPDRPSTLLTRQLLASVRADQGHLAEAKAELQQVRDAELQVLGSDHPQNLDTRHEIARVLADLGRLSEAEAGFREVLYAKLRVLGPDHPSTLLTRATLRQMSR